MSQFVKLICIIFVTLCSLNTFALTTPLDVSNDTVFFDLKMATITFNNGERYLDLPIYVKTKGPRSSFDFRMKFNQEKLEYISTTKVNAQLEPFTYLNPNDNFLRNNTAGPFVSYEIPNNTPLIFVRFKLKQNCASIFASDFFNITTLLVGYPSKNKVTQMESIKNITNLLASGSKCSKNTLTFVGPSQTGGVPIAFYKWDFGNGSVSTLQSVNTSYLEAGEYVVNLNVQTVDGCKDSINQLINISETPIASFDYTTDKSLDTVYFTNYSSVANDTMTFEWKFGDQSSSFAKTPKHHYNAGGSYVVELIVRTENNCYANYTSTIILQKPIPDFSYSSNACAKSEIAFTNTSTFGNGSIVEWNWDFGDSTTSNLQDPTHIFSRAGLFVIHLVITSDKGIQSEIYKTIEINNKPIVNFDANLTTGCVPLKVSFSNTSKFDNGSKFIYDFGDNEMSTQSDPVHSFNLAKTYSIKQVIIAPGGCKDSLIKIGYIKVSSNPEAKFYFTNGCLNTLINFKDSSEVKDGSIVAWNWNLGDGNSLYSQNVINTFSVAGNYPIKLTVTTSQGCSDSKIDTIKINPKPKVQFNALTTNGCIPLTPSFKDFSTTVPGSFYFWNFGDNTYSYEKSPSKIYLKDGNFNVKLAITAPGGCTDSLILLNYINPLSLVTAKFSESTHCANSIINFNDSSTVGSGKISSWSWDFGNGTSSNQSNPSTIFNKAGNYTVKLTVSSDQNCQNSFTKEITVDEVPKVNFEADKTNGCFPDVIVFNNKSTYMDGTVFHWDFGDGFTQQIFSPSHKYLDIDSFTVVCKAVTPQGCTDSLLRKNYISIKISPISKFEITNKNFLIPGYKLNFNNLSTTSTEYIWSFGDSTISALKNPSHQFIDSGKYNICLVAKNSEYCKSVFCERVNVKFPGAIAVPNAFSPNNDGKNDEFKVLGGPINNMSLKIFNNWGSIVFSSEIQNQGWDGTFNGNNQPIGEYSYHLTGVLSDGTEVNKTGVVNLTR